MEQQISSLVLKINGHQVILDFDLAKLYGVTTKVLNQAVKRNPSRFPNDIAFQIEQQKKDELVTNCDRLKTLKHSLHSPYAYTECLIYTERITPAIKLDLEKHNSQYPTIHIRILKNTHDRFLIIDNRELYHLGASLKDLGKRWFAFSLIDGFLKEVQARLK
jgi:hypothetical protein